MVRAVAPLKSPPSFSPSILILFPLRSTYYEKITPFLSIGCEKQHWSHVSSFPSQERTLHDVTDEVTKSLILEALRRCHGNRRHAVRTLGIARDSLYRYMKRFGIESEKRTADQDDWPTLRHWGICNPLIRQISVALWSVIRTFASFLPTLGISSPYPSL